MENSHKFSKVKILNKKEIPKDLSIEEKEKLVMENELLKQELQVYAEKTSDLFAKFRMILFSSVLDKAMKSSTELEAIVIMLNRDNKMYVIIQKEKVIVLFGVNFTQKTDYSLARVFLQEIEDTKRHIRNSLEVKSYPNSGTPPSELVGIESNFAQFSNGFIAFSKILFN